MVDAKHERKRGVGTKRAGARRRRAMPFIAAVLGMALLASCSSRPADSEVAAVRAEIERARQAEAEVWAPDALRTAGEALQAALDAIAAENGKWFKNYDRAKQFLARAREEARGAADAAIAAKAQAKDDATAALSAAEASLEQARSRLDAAPRSSISRGDRSMFRSDFESLPKRIKAARDSLESGAIKEALESATDVESAAADLLQRVEGLLDREPPPPK